MMFNLVTIFFVIKEIKKLNENPFTERVIQREMIN